MSSEKISQRFPGQTLGWGFSLRLSLYFAIVFTVGALGLLFIGYNSIARAFEAREISTLEERLYEYRAWLDLGLKAYNDEFEDPLKDSAIRELVAARFNSQVDLSRDDMFLRLEGNSILDKIFLCSPGCDLHFDRETIDGLPERTSEAGLFLGGESQDHLWAVASIPLDVLGGGFLQAGKSIGTGEAVLDRFRQIFLLGVLPALFVGIIGGTLMTYQSIGPIRVLINTIHDILRTGDLSRRAESPKGGDELTPLVNAFNRLLGRQERLIDSMHTSLDSVAHDLRTPMARLRATAEIALQSPDEGSKHTEALSDCLEESDHVLSMLRTLMELSEAEAGAMRLRLEDVSMDDILKTVVELYEFVAEEKHIKVVLEPSQNDVTLVADRARLLQLFANLVDNALKFSPSETTVTLGAHSTRNHVQAWVQDAGPGIREEDQSRIWDRLYRGDRSRSTRGVGLGLSFVRAISEAHGGSAQVQTAPDQGCRFIVRLPIDPPPDAGERVDLTIEPDKSS
ncbi:MAG: signal transduction histidine kinase [Verrucomicrobiales bacterium]|jgi:signal transduction histidine kinase